MTQETNKIYTPNNQIQEKFRTLNTIPDVVLLSYLPLWTWWLGAGWRAIHFLFHLHSQMWRLVPLPPPEQSVTSTFITRLPAKGRHQRLSFKQSQGTTPLALPLAGTEMLLIPNPIPKSCKCLLSSLKKKSLPHLSTLHMENLLVDNYFICALPQGMTDQDAKSVFLLPSKARSHMWMQSKPHTTTSLPLITHII